ncbi:MAG: NAD(P)H-binding protein [Bacteroidetes bacterium]|nr:NAD(P)H-binding protein [Bacteroidota bacterium]
MAKTALLIGSTGLIGQQLLELLLQSETYSKVIAIARKPLSINHPKLEVVVFPLTELDANASKLIADDVFCCLGTTMKQAKSKQAFRAVDFDAPLALAKIVKNHGARQYLLVSALGANKNSSIFYNRVKGEIEEEISKIGFESFHIVRPSLLLGDRPDQRAGEEAAQFFYKVFGKLIPTKYKAIDSAKVARALAALAAANHPGHWVHESGSLQTY